MIDRKIYNFINVMILLVSAFLFILKYDNIQYIIDILCLRDNLIIVITVIMVHLIKSLRLYLALYGLDIEFGTYLKLYCKVTPVSVILPFKIGEMFRMYCYGRQLKSKIRGVVIILLDRFMDTLALVIMMLGVEIISGKKIPIFVYLLILFLAMMVTLYIMFPGGYVFWKKYLLSSKATEKSISALSIFEVINMIYKELSDVASGRGIILFLLSVFAWGVELGSVIIGFGHVNGSELEEVISRYLFSALGIGKSTELERFVIISVLLLVVAYIGLKITDVINVKKVCHEGNSCI